MAEIRRLKTRKEHRAKLDAFVDDLNDALTGQGWTKLIAFRRGDELWVGPAAAVPNLTALSSVNTTEAD
jgi:hypothetical protein